jgi:TolA-binding protein
MTAERYVAGRLDEAARDAFEEHYFACDRCFGRVEILRAAQQALPLAKTKPVAWWVWALPLAAAVLLAIFLLRPAAPPAQVAVSKAPARDYSALARFDAPAWNPEQLRGSESAAHRAFLSAMALYKDHDYAGCAARLDRIASTEARYYEGVSLLLAGQSDRGAAKLRAVIAEGDTPYLEEARFYLAKALLARNDVTGAQAELRRVVLLHGDLEHKASELLNMIK